MKFDPRLYLVTDPELLGRRDLIEVVRAAVAGGVTLVQLRDKAASGRALTEAARALVECAGVPVVVNDRVDVAHAARAGVHLGQTDLPVDAARAILGPEAIIGVSVERLVEATAIGSADYVAASPVFDTPTKPDAAPPLGLAGLAQLTRLVSVPVVGIGGIHAGNAETVFAAGAAGVAVVSAIMRAPDPERAARALRERSP